MIVKKINLSYEQNGIFYGCLNGLSKEYIISAVVESSHMNQNALDKALESVVREQEMLRACVLEIDGKPFIGIYDSIELPIMRFDMRSQANEDVIKAIDAFMDEEFDLYKPGLFWIREYILTDEKSYFVLKMHHIISDGISMSQMFADLIKKYNDVLDNKEPDFNLNNGYELYTKKQLKRDGNKSYLRKKKNWSEHLKDAQHTNIFKNDAGKIGYGKERKFMLPKSTVAAVKKLASEYEVTEYSVYLAVFYVLLQKYTRTYDLLVSAPFSNRDLFEAENTVGCFAANLPLRVQLEDNEHFSNIMRDSFQEILFAYKNVGYPNYLIAGDNFDDISQKKIWDISFVYNVFPIDGIDLDASFVPTENTFFFGMMNFALANDFKSNLYIKTPVSKF